MSRRHFLKMLFSVFILVFGGFWSFLRRLFGMTEEPEPDEPDQVVAAGERTEQERTGQLLFSMFLLSDLHISLYDTTTSDKLKATLDDITQLNPNADAVVMGGDLTDYGREGEYKLLWSLLDSYDLPKLHANMGNHDYYDIWINDKGGFATDTMPNGKTDAQSRERFQQYMNYDKPYADEWINGIHLIMLSQEAYLQEREEVGEGAWYSDEQLNWLQNKMAEHTDGEPALIMIHQPLPAVGSDGGTHRLIRANEFREILKPYRNVFVFSGHTHRDFYTDNHYATQENIHWFSNSAVGRLRPSAPSTDSHAQGMYIQVYEKEIHVRGREFTTRQWIDVAEWRVPMESASK
ncbi:hypothetical protein J2TS4_41880 [Paenibacillus sp. J2TS4]|nr:hypothetical protein J2TS4_41880 [Paenibacillus sp. J2TS4]